MQGIRRMGSSPCKQPGHQNSQFNPSGKGSGAKEVARVGVSVTAPMSPLSERSSMFCLCKAFGQHLGMAGAGLGDHLDGHGGVAERRGRDHTGPRAAEMSNSVPRRPA